MIAQPDPRPPTQSVSVLALRPMVSGFSKLGIDDGSLLSQVGLTREQLADPDDRVSYDQLWSLWVLALEASGDACLGLHVAETVEPSDYGTLGYIIASSSTMRESIARLQRFHRLLADAARYSFEQTATGYTFRHEVEGGGSAPSPIAEYVVAAPLVLIRKILGREQVIEEARFAHEAPTDTSEYERVFDAPVRFASGENAMLVSVDVDSPVPSADPALGAVLERYAQSLVDDLPEEASLAAAVRKVVAKSLPDGVPPADEVGRRLSVSPRTLRRHLREYGTSISEIVHDVRRELALRYLSSADLTVSEVAYLLGFSEPAAFHRAFKRWQGCTPLEHRRLVRG